MTAGEEHVLLDSAVPGTYRLQINTVNFLTGDAIEIRVYLALLSGSTPKQAVYEMYEGNQDDDETVKFTDWVSSDASDPSSAFRATIRQVRRQSRITPLDIPWKVYKRQGQ